MDLDSRIFDVPVRRDLLHSVVQSQLAGRRAGTAATKSRAQVSGGGAKPFRQKGTGRARQGTTRAPQWAGGGSVFGPVPRSHNISLPKKVRRAALRGAVSLRVSEGAVTVVEALALDAFKTKRVAEILEGLGVGVDGVLIVIHEADPVLERSARNLRGVSVLRAAGLNVYDVLRHPKLVATKAAVAAIEQRLGGVGVAS